MVFYVLANEELTKHTLSATLIYQRSFLARLILAVVQESVRPEFDFSLIILYGVVAIFVNMPFGNR